MIGLIACVSKFYDDRYPLINANYLNTLYDILLISCFLRRGV